MFTILLTLWIVTSVYGIVSVWRPNFYFIVLGYRFHPLKRLYFSSKTLDAIFKSNENQSRGINYNTDNDSKSTFNEKMLASVDCLVWPTALLVTIIILIALCLVPRK